MRVAMIVERVTLDSNVFKEAAQPFCAGGSPGKGAVRRPEQCTGATMENSSLFNVQKAIR